MKNNYKKVVSAILAMVMAVTMGISAYAEDIPVIDMGTFHLSSLPMEAAEGYECEDAVRSKTVNIVLNTDGSLSVE